MPHPNWSTRLHKTTARNLGVIFLQNRPHPHPVSLLTLIGEQCEEPINLIRHGVPFEQILGLENNPTVFANLTQTHRKLHSSLRSRIKLLECADHELFTIPHNQASRIQLALNQLKKIGCDHINLDWCGTFNEAKRQTLALLAQHPALFERPWQFGNDALITTTICLDREKSAPLDTYLESNVPAHALAGKLHNFKKHAYGILAFLRYHLRPYGMDAKSIFSYGYRDHLATMLTCGFAISKITPTTERPKTLEIADVFVQGIAAYEGDPENTQPKWFQTLESTPLTPNDRHALADIRAAKTKDVVFFQHKTEQEHLVVPFLKSELSLPFQGNTEGKIREIQRDQTLFALAQTSTSLKDLAKKDGRKLSVVKDHIKRYNTRHPDNQIFFPNFTNLKLAETKPTLPFSGPLLQTHQPTAAGFPLPQ
jgi:hypothetical protein